MMTQHILRLYSLLIISFIVTLHYTTTAQPRAAWMHAAGGNGFEFFRGMTISERGKCIYAIGGYGVLGDSISFEDTTLHGSGTFVVKYDFSGNLLWAKGFAYSEASAVANTIATDKDGNVYFAGGFAGIVNFDSIILESASGNILLVKLNPAGKVLWAKSFGYDYHDQMTDVADVMAIDSKDRIYLSGVFIDSINFGNGFNLKTYRNNSIAGFIAKFDKDGNTLWADAYGSSHFPGGPEILTINQNDDLYLLGGGSDSEMYYRDIVVQHSDNRNSDFFLKIDSLGTPLWGKFLEGDGGYRIGSITIAKDSGSYLSGSFYDTLKYDQLQLNPSHEPPPPPPWNNYPYSNGFLIKLDKYDKAEWGKVFSGDTSVQTGKVVIDQEGNGWTGIGFYPSLFLETDTLNNKAGSSTLIKMDASGAIMETFHKEIGDVGVSICCIDPSANIYFGEAFVESIRMGEFSATSKGYTDIFLAKFAVTPTGIDGSGRKNNMVSLYPNPSSGAFILDMDNLNNWDAIEVYNIFGQQVYSSTITHHQTESLQVSLDDAPAGVYQVAIWGTEGRFTGRVVVVR